VDATQYRFSLVAAPPESVENLTSMKTITLFPLIFIGCLIGPSYATAQATDSAQPIREFERPVLTPSTEMITQGKNVAEAHCADCHGMDGLGSGDGQPYLAGQRAVYLFRVLEGYQQRGQMNESMAHISSSLNDQAMLAVAAYYANLSPGRSPETETESETAASLGDDPFASLDSSLSKCIRCHGETGNSASSGMPSLTAQHPEYFVTSMKAYADGSRSHRLMGRLVGALDESTIEQMGLYYAVQDPLRSEILGEGDAETGSRGAEACANCHGADGNASGNDMPTLAGQDARYFTKAMQAYKSGERKHEDMFEAVEALSDREIDDLATFYATQAPLRRDVRTPISTAEWVARCERCHGLDGNSTDPRFPMLAGQNREYLRRALEAYTTGTRSQSIMHAMARPLTATDVEQIVTFYSTRNPKSAVFMQLPCLNENAN
jgi:cytochrome c553